jgi:hypothetical protein
VAGTDPVRRLVRDDTTVLPVLGRDPDDPSRMCRLTDQVSGLEIEVGRERVGDLRAQTAQSYDVSVRATVDVFGPVQRVSGLGDAGVAGVWDSTMRVIARRGNLLVMVDYRPGPDRPADGGRADCVAVARAVLAAARVS